MNNFKDITISNEIIEALKAQNIISPTPIQQEAIPKIAENKDVILKSATGTGKTLAYILPLISKINHNERKNQFIILVPTHELALQVHNVLNELTKFVENEITSTVIMGDVNIKRQVEKLKEKPQFVIGSPGRILELIKLKKISAHTVKTIVIDECDKLLDKNNIETVKSVIKTTLKDRQVILSSATITDEVLSIGKEMMKTPELINCSSDLEVNPNISHLYIVCDKRDKIITLRKLMAGIKPNKAIAFINKSEEIETLVAKLQHHGLNVNGIHGSFVKNERQKSMQDFKTGKINLLVSSDLSSRGLDIDDVTHIFNLDMPEDINTYVHRSGRTARGSKSGIVISIVTPMEISKIKNYSKKLNFTLTEKTLSYGQLCDVKTVVKDSDKLNKNNKSNKDSKFDKNNKFDKNSKSNTNNKRTKPKSKNK